MKLVVTYTVGDACTYCCDEVRAVEYESAEAFIVDFEKAAREAKEKRQWEFNLANLEWSCGDFFHSNVLYCPEVHSLEEWFENNVGR